MKLFQAMAPLLYFTLAGLCEIGGGYLIWLWLKEHRPVSFGLAGAVLLIAFGYVMTMLPANFGRSYAAYGGIFVAMSLLWGWLIDKQLPDLFDLMGVTMVLLGVGVMIYWPRP
ncbi:MAG: YnfA family protein [Candidatus Sericytochromatia bacterium]